MSSEFVTLSRELRRNNCLSKNALLQGPGFRRVRLSPDAPLAEVCLPLAERSRPAR